MKLHLLSVQSSKRGTGCSPQIQICADWLSQLGFIENALVQAVPEPNGFAFELRNENICYSDVFGSTKDRGGTLIRVNYLPQRGLFLSTKGSYICSSGLSIGDCLVAKCEYACLRIRKVPEKMRILHPTKTKKPYTGEAIPKVSLWGDWLNEIGFWPDTLVSITIESGHITLAAQANIHQYREVVPIARKEKMQLVQVTVHNGKPYIELTPDAPHRAGFGAEDILTITYGFGGIVLQKLDLVKFDF